MHTNKLILGVLVAGAVVLGTMVYLLFIRDAGTDVPRQSDPAMEDAIEPTDETGKSQVTHEIDSRGEPRKSDPEIESSAAGGQERVAPARIDLLRCGQVMGRVVDEEKNPIVDAEVALYMEQRVKARVDALEQAPERRLYQTRTDHQGCYVLSNIPAPGRYELTASAEGYVSLERPFVSVTPKETKNVPDLILGKGWRLFGSVTDIKGKPLAGALVFFELASKDNRILEWINDEVRADIDEADLLDLELFHRCVSLRKKTTTDEAGNFDFGPIGAGRYRVGASSEGYSLVINRSINTRDASREKGIRVDLKLEGAMMIRGVVKDSDQNPLPGAEIRAELDGGPDRSSLAVGLSREDDGLFKLGNLVRGRYIVSARKEGYLPSFSTDVEAGSSQVILVMLKTAELSGQAVAADTGKPIKNFFATVCKKSPKRDAGLTPVRPWENFQDSEGRFTVAGLSRGRYHLVVRVDGYGIGFSTDVALQEEEQAGPLIVKVEKGFTLKGRVVNSRGGPVEGASVALQAGTKKLRNMTQFFGEQAAQIQKDEPLLYPGISTDGEGRFVFGAVQPGQYSLMITHPDYEDLLVSGVIVEPQETNSAGKLVMTQGGSLLVTVYGPSGEPAPKAMCKIIGVDVSSFFHAQTDMQGSFRLVNLTPGTYEVTLNPTHLPMESGMVNPQAVSKVTVTVREGKETSAELYAR